MRRSSANRDGAGTGEASGVLRRPHMIAAAGAGCGASTRKPVGADRLGGISYSPKVMSTASRQFCAGWMLISITPGIGVTLNHFDPGSRAANSPRHGPGSAFLGGRLHRRDQFEVVFDLLDRRMKATRCRRGFDRQRRAHRFGFAFSLVFAPSVLVSVSKVVSASRGSIGSCSTM